MVRNVIYAVAAAAVVFGCASRSTTRSASCPMPARSADSGVMVIPVADTIPMLKDDGIECVIWQDSEGDGHVARFIRKRDGKIDLSSVHLDDESYASLRDRTDELKSEIPAFKDRHLWTFCRTEGEFKL